MNTTTRTTLRINGHPYQTGDWPEMYPYIGDPVPCEPNIEIVPDRVKIYPIGPATVPNTDWWRQALQPIPNVSVGTIAIVPNPWNVQFKEDRVIARCDVPGAKLENINVELINCSIKVSYCRFDTGGWCYPQDQIIGPDYDPKTAEATLESGVLTVTVKRFAEKLAHKVTVTQK